MNRPPYPLVSSGRRPSAGPEPQFGQPSFSMRPAAALAVVGLAATLMVSPAIVAVLAVTSAGQLDGFDVRSIVPFYLAPILEFGRILLTVALATRVMRVTELE